MGARERRGSYGKQSGKRDKFRFMKLSWIMNGLENHPSMEVGCGPRANKAVLLQNREKWMTMVLQD